MSYDAGMQANFNGRTSYYLYMYVRRDQTDIANNRSSYAWAFYMRGPGGSWVYNPQPWACQVGGVTVGSGSRALDMSNTSEIVLGSGTTGWFGHDGNGYLNLSFGGWLNNSADGPFGYAEGYNTLYTDRIPQNVAAPTANFIDQIGTTSFRYSFSGNSDGGSPITGWQAQTAWDAGFTQNVETFSSPGTSTITGRIPGKRYYVRSRGANQARGWSPNWSNTLSAQMLSGGYVGKGSDFQGTEILVAKSGAFVTPDIMVGKGGAFVAAI